jgi:hypothetical protein
VNYFDVAPSYGNAQDAGTSGSGPRALSQELHPRLKDRGAIPNQNAGISLHLSLTRLRCLAGTRNISVWRGRGAGRGPLG